MTIVTVISSVSHRYYEKRNRSVAELNIKQMSESLGKPIPEGLSTMPKGQLVNLALSLHSEFPNA